MRPEPVETWNGLGNTPSLFQTVVLIAATCNHESFYIINLTSPYFNLFSKCIIVFILGREIFLIFCLSFYLLCRGGDHHFDVHFRRIGPYFFLSNDGKDAVREGRNGWKGVHFPPESASFPSIISMIKVLFYVCTLIWRVNNFVSRQGKVSREEMKVQLIL